MSPLKWNNLKSTHIRLGVHYLVFDRWLVSLILFRRNGFGLVGRFRPSAKSRSRLYRPYQLFSNGVGTKRTIRTLIRSVYTSCLPLSWTLTFSLFHFSSSFALRSGGTCKRYSDAQVSIRYIRSSVLLILGDDILDSWNMCLFISLSWPFFIGSD